MNDASPDQQVAKACGSTSEPPDELRSFTFDLDASDRNFIEAVLSAAGGETVLRCFACGTCSAGCPVRAVTERYNPRRIVQMIRLGMAADLLDSDFIWLCSSCYSCQERCPQGVRIADLIIAVRNLAALAGKLHQGYEKQRELVATLGRLYEITDFDNKKRQKLGLPPVVTAFEDLRVLFASLKDDRG